MKQIKTLLLALALVITSVSLNAQFHVGGGFGYSTARAATGSIAVGYDFKYVDLSAGLISHISSTVGKGTLFNVKLGHTFNINELWSIQPAIGGAFNYQSADDKSLNTSTTMYSVYAYKTINGFPTAQIQFGVDYAQKTTIFSVGLRLNCVSDY